MSTDNPGTDVLPRFAYQNFGKMTRVTLVPSSEDTQYPVEHIVDPLRSKTWRSKLGWNIKVGFNDRLDFTEATTGDASAVITPGNYATGALVAAEIQSAMNTAATDNTYVVTYSSTTFKFTIARDVGADAFGLEWSTGANTTRSIGKDLGFNIATDDTGAVTYTSDYTIFKSREWVVFTLAVGAMGVKEAIVLDFNWNTSSTSGDQVYIQGSTSDAWTGTGVFTELLDDEHADGHITLSYFAATETYQYWRVLIEDQCYNNAGFTEIGLCLFGGYLMLSKEYSYKFTESRNELSEAMNADQGAPWVNIKKSPKRWTLPWPAVTETDKANLHTMQNMVKINRGFFFSFAPSTAPERTEYVKLTKALSFSPVSHNLYAVTISLEEALG